MIQHDNIVVISETPTIPDHVNTVDLKTRSSIFRVNAVGTQGLKAEYSDKVAAVCELFVQLSRQLPPNSKLRARVLRHFDVILRT